MCIWMDDLLRGTYYHGCRNVMEKTRRDGVHSAYEVERVLLHSCGWPQGNRLFYDITPFLSFSAEIHVAFSSKLTMANERSLLLDGMTPSIYSSDHESNLLKFRRAIGINTSALDSPAYLADLEIARQTARGLYKQVITAQRLKNRLHRIFEAIFYTALGVQIILGAVLTALGPVAKLHSRAITVLGIFNTSIAGLLTILKGQGLPERFRKDEYQMKKVQNYIEEMDVRLSVGGADEFTAEELDEVVQEIWARYNAAVDGAERNKLNISFKRKDSGRERRDANQGKVIDPIARTKL